MVVGIAVMDQPLPGRQVRRDEAKGGVEEREGNGQPSLVPQRVAQETTRDVGGAKVREKGD